MGGSSTCIEKLHKAAGMIQILSLLGAICLIFFVNTALAGTETGEFCPDCVDWANEDAWLVKKEAYDRQQMEAMLGRQQVVSIPPEQPKVAASPKKYPAPELLTSATAINDKFVILDVRSAQEYENGHISGARNLYWKDMQKSGLLDEASAQAMLRKAGVNNTDRILIYGGSDEGAFFAFWAFNYLGHENMSLLDGGVESAWKAGQKPVTIVNVFPESNYTAHIASGLLVGADDLEALFDQSDIEILDARDFIEYGKSKLTNSSIPLTADKLYEDSKIKDAKTLEDMLNRRDLNSKGVQLVYGTPQAYSLFFGLKLMGYNATLLEGDWWQRSKWAVNKIR